MSAAPLSSELRCALARLEAADPIRALVELAAEDDDPALTAAVARRLLGEIRVEKEGHHAGRV